MFFGLMENSLSEIYLCISVCLILRKYGFLRWIEKKMIISVSFVKLRKTHGSKYFYRNNIRGTSFFWVCDLTDLGDKTVVYLDRKIYCMSEIWRDITRSEMLVKVDVIAVIRFKSWKISVIIVFVRLQLDGSCIFNPNHQANRMTD